MRDAGFEPAKQDTSNPLEKSQLVEHQLVKSF
jgi:hypothetical protein